MEHIAKWVPSRAAVLGLAPIQVQKFFTRNPTLTEQACCEQAACILGCQIDRISPTAVQGACSFTLVAVDGSPGTPAIVQFRHLSSPLDISTINLACQTYGGVVPTYENVTCGLSDQVHVYLITLVASIAFSAAQKELYQDDGGQRLTRTVRDFASFVAYSLSSARYCTDSDRLNQAYGELAVWENTLPAQFLSKLTEVRGQLPVIFGPEFPHVLNHVNLVEMNMNVDEESGPITGIIDWAGAQFGPFGAALGSLEIFLGICRGDGAYFRHPQEHCLRTVFYETLYENLTWCQARRVNADAVEAARAFFLFTRYGSRAGQDRETASLEDALLGAYLAEGTAAQPFLQQLWSRGCD